MIDVKFEFNGETYYGAEDFMKRADLSRYTVVDKETGEIVNPYEFFWKFFREALNSQKEKRDEDYES